MTLAQAVLILPFLSLAGLVAAAPCSTSTTTTYHQLAVGSPGLGQLFYLPDKELQTNGEFNSGYDVFKFASDCVVRANATGPGQQSDKKHYSSSEALYSSQAFGFSLQGGFPVQSLILSGSVQSVTQTSSDYTDQLVSAKVYEEIFVESVDYKNSDSCRQFTEEFLGHFEALPDIDPKNAAKIMDTGPSGPWHAYINFLQNYGSHIMTQQKLGGAFWEWTSSETVSSADSRQMQIRACANLRAQNNISLSTCADYSEQELRESQSLDASSYKKVMGGTADAQRALMSNPSSETLTAFILASLMHPNAYQYDFKPIWDQLKNQYQEQCAASSDTSNACKSLQKAYNLQAAFVGVKAWECHKSTSDDGVLLQSLEVQGADSNPVSYQCRAGYTGCSSNNMCTGKGAHGGGCVCRGEGCFVGSEIANGVYRTVVSRDNGGGTGDGVNQACYCAGVGCAMCHCDVNREWTSRPDDFPLERIIWTQDS